MIKFYLYLRFIFINDFVSYVKILNFYSAYFTLKILHFYLTIDVMIFSKAIGTKALSSVGLDGLHYRILLRKVNLRKPIENNK